jgi:hypothetical protein
MNSLFYLLYCSVKNSLRETVRKPVRLIMYLAVIFLIGVSLAGNALTRRDPAEFKDIHLLGGMFFALVTMFLLFSLNRAFKSGGSLFQMSDVNLLFVSPAAPQKILIYGVIQCLKNAQIAGLFILFQGGVSGRVFGTGFSSLLLVIGIFALCFCLSEIIAILVYSITNGANARRLTAKIAVALIFLPLVITVFTGFVREGGPVTALLYICKSPAFQMTPVSGWGAAALVAFLKGHWFTGGLFIALTASVIAGLLVLLFRLKSDYYEDVLVATESIFEKKRAVAEGNPGMAAAVGQKIRIAKTGLSGLGARALFGKHLRETFRGSRFGFIDIRTVLYTAAASAFALIRRDSPENALLLILQYFVWLQVFAIAMGPPLREFYAHYIYLLPEPPRTKLIWNSLMVVLKTGVDAILIFGIAGLILRENPLIIAGAIFTASMFALMLVGINIFGLRWTSLNLSAGVLVVIYLFIVIIVLVPGLIPALFVAHIIPGNAGVIAALGIVSLWEIVVSFICFVLSQSILNRCDMPVVKMPE